MRILDRAMAILDLMRAVKRQRRAARAVAQAGSQPGFVSRQVVWARRYFLDLRPGRGGLRVACGGCERVRSDYLVDRTDFPYLCVEFVAAGEGSVMLAGRESPLVPGSVFSYGPGMPHTIRTHPRRRLTKYYVDFTGSEGSRRLVAAGLAPGACLRTSRPDEIRDLFEVIQQAGLAQSASSQQACGELVGVLLVKLGERARPGGDGDDQPRATFEAFKRLLDERRQSLRSVSEAAAAFGISDAYACRLFQRFDSMTPYRYLLRQRLNLAAEMLGEPGVLVRDVAARLGFADQYQFSRAFKRVLGLPPAAFQRMK